MSIKMVAGIRRNPTAVVMLDESDIKTPKDLEGKTVAIPTGATQFQQWPAFVKGCGLDADKIRIANIDPAGSPSALITGQGPAIAGYAQGLYAERRDPRQQKGSHSLVCRLRRHRGQ